MNSLVIAHRYDCYRILSHIGDRFVWLAKDTLFGRTVVIKASLSEGGSIIHEYQMLRQYTHPRLVCPFDVGYFVLRQESGERRITFMAEEWLPGPSLRALAGQLDVIQIEELAADLIELLAFLHNCGLTRLDLKPHHVLRTDAGWKLIDLDQARADRALDPAEPHGTLAYLAPECLDGNAGGCPGGLVQLGSSFVRSHGGLTSNA